MKILVALVASELVFLLPLAWVLRRKSLVREFSGFYAYIWVYVLADVLYIVSRGVFLSSLVSMRTAQEIYNYPNAVLFLIESVVTIWLMYQLFQKATSGVPGIQKLGTMVFQWATVIAIIMAVSTIFTPHSQHAYLMGLIQMQVGRSTSILALCLVTFFAFTAQKLGMGYGSRVFGISFGLAMLATNQLVRDAFVWSATSSTQALFINIMGELPQFAVMALWMVYFLKAEPARKLITLPSTSPLILWNETARLLGNSAGQVVVSYPDSFMPNVREVAEKAAHRDPAAAQSRGLRVVS